MHKGILITIMLAWCSVANAHNSSSPAASVRADIQMLHSSRWKVRHAAQQALMLKSTTALPAVAAAIAHDQTLEMAIRLRRIGLQLFLEQYLQEGGRRPFLGIRFLVLSRLPELHRRSAIYVEKVLRGLPAGRVLRRGDLILGINGRYFGPGMTGQDFIELMSQFKAGDHVVLTVLRGGRRLNARIRLFAVPVDDLQLATWLNNRTLLIDRYLLDLGKLTKSVQPNGSVSPIIFPGMGKHPKS
jgi:hypothetical protein